MKNFGYKKCLIPESNKKVLKENYKLDIIGVKNVLDALKPLNFDRKVVVVGFGGEVTSQLVGNEAEVVWQKNIIAADINNAIITGI